MITDIKFDCAHCGQRMVVASEAAGLATECPSCRTSITIPAQAALLDRNYEPQPPVRGTAPSTKLESREPARPDLDDLEFATLRQELVEASTQIRRLDGEIAELKQGEAAAAKAAEQARGEIEKLQADKKRLRDDIAAVKAQVATTEAALTESKNLLLTTQERGESQTAQLTAELTDAKAMLEEALAELTTLTATIDALKSANGELHAKVEGDARELAAVSARLAEREAELEATQHTLGASQAAHLTASRELTSVTARLETAENQVAQTKLSLVETVNLLQATKTELHAAKTEGADLQAQLTEAKRDIETTQARLQEVEAERDGLRKSLSEDTAGRDLVEAREALKSLERDRDALAGRVTVLSHDLEAAVVARRANEEQIRTLLRDLEESRRRAEATSELRLRQDNEVLRGIIARQNAELEQKHVQVVRLKRARLAVRLAYAAFGMGLLAVAVWAMKVVPGVGKLF